MGKPCAEDKQAVMLCRSSGRPLVVAFSRERTVPKEIFYVNNLEFGMSEFGREASLNEVYCSPKKHTHEFIEVFIRYGC